MRRPALIAVALAAAGGQAAGGAVATAATSAPAATARLHASAVSGAGCQARRVAVPVTGVVVARLLGAPEGPDRDLAVRRSGGLLGASRAFGAAEVVQVAARAGDALVVRACGTGPPAPLRVHVVVPRRPPAAAAPRTVSVAVSGAAAARRLAALGMDANEVLRDGRVDVVVRGSAGVRRLRRAGFAPRPVPPAASQGPAARAAAAGTLPSGRTRYRDLAAYQAGLKRLVAEHPGLVRPVVLPGTSVLGRPLQGVEIAEDVAADDGRPVHVQLGLHHAREWSSGEVVMEHAVDLVRRHDRGDPRVKRLLRRVRTVLLPVMNPDGLVEAQAAGLEQADPAGALSSQGLGSYRRKNCAGAGALGCGPGVDLNRNFGAFWGGPGASDSPSSQTYRGPAPFSEPEAQALRAWSSGRHIAVLNANHNYGGVVLHQPGFARSDQPGLSRDATVPYAARMAALAAGMADAAGYASGPAHDLYDVTGAAEDWNYFTQGTFGFTTEIGHQGFHPPYGEAVVATYLGGPGERDGLAEAFLRAGEAAAGLDTHALLAGAAPAGSLLRLRKDVETTTSYVLSATDSGFPRRGEARLLPDRLESTLAVGPSGRFEWHVNPSTRPLALLAGEPEAWALSCEDPSGAVLERREVVIALAERQGLELSCGGAPGAALRVRSAAAAGRRVAVRLATEGGPLRRVRIAVRDARGRVRASAARSRASRTVRLRARRALPGGRYRVDVRAVSPSGRTLSAGRTLRVR